MARRTLPLPHATGAHSLNSSWVMGVDENGLGPLLGPMVVTGVLARTSKIGKKTALGPLRGELAARLGDSKRLVRFGQTALSLAWARAVCERNGIVVASPADLVDRLLLESEKELTRICPRGHKAQCWNRNDDWEASDAALSQAHDDLAFLAKKGVEIVNIRSQVVCTRAINLAAARGISRLILDLHAMENLVLDGRANAKTDIEAVCGKVGGYDAYGPHFGPLASRLRTTMREGRAESRYDFVGVGEVSFARDAEDAHLVVAIASMVGKWVRDIFMRRVFRFHGGGMAPVSGYHDPRTLAYVSATALARKAREFSDECFLRARAK